MGHKKLNTTMIFARAYDQTVEEDYFQSMSSVEKRLELLDGLEEEEKTVSERAREALLTLMKQLIAPDMSLEMHLELAERLRTVLVGTGNIEPTSPPTERRQPDHNPQPSLSILDHWKFNTDLSYW